MSSKVHPRLEISLLALAWVVLAIPLASCSSNVPSENVPSESDGRKLLENVANAGGIYKVKSFRKTKGVLDPDGSKYRLEFEAEVECLKVYRVDPGIEVYEWSLYVPCNSVGETKKLSKALVFQKTEEGWTVRFTHAASAAPNNGMHPTADTTLVIYLKSLGAAGDAGR